MNTSLVRTWLTVLGIGMVVLWIAGLSSPIASRWMVWLDLVAAALTFIGVAGTRETTDRSTRAGGTIALSAGVFAIWLGGMVNGAVPWLTWWNFIFACGYLLVGIAASRRGGRAAGDTTVPLRRSA